MEKLEKATLGGGCFWCLEAVYQLVNGVETVESGYAGGTTTNPTYEQLHREDTGHAEVVQIGFDPSKITYRELLEIFYYIHDPTTPNRQGNDVGPEYRSIILFHNEQQHKAADDVIHNFAPTLWDKPIATEVVPLREFWPAEDYHQNFFRKNPRQAYCQIIINPKLAKFRQKFESKLKADTTL